LAEVCNWRVKKAYIGFRTSIYNELNDFAATTYQRVVVQINLIVRTGNCVAGELNVQ
jgi:hypothetical protein